MTAPQQNSLEKRIRSLLRHPAFRRLRTRSDRFRPMEALGIAHREHSHSNFLAFLLDPDGGHGLQDRFLRDFIALVADSEALTEGRDNPLPLTAELKINPDKVQVYRERFNIDVLIDCRTEGPVIGIEAKVWAGEQHRQVARYQNRLESTYVGRQSLIVFLTPDGRQPDSGSKNHGVPCVCISWASIAELIDGVIGSGGNDKARPFIEEFSRHLKELTMENEEDRALAGALFKDPEMVKVFRDIQRLRPRLWDQQVMAALKKKGKDVIQKITRSKVDVEVIDKKGDAMMHFAVEDWRRKGIPVKFTFYHCPGWDRGDSPGLHALLFDFDSFNEDEKKEYRSIASKCESLATDPVKARGWSKKHSAFQNPPNGADIGWIIQDESFDEEWIENAIEMLGERVRQIHEEIEAAKSQT